MKPANVRKIDKQIAKEQRRVEKQQKARKPKEGK